MSKREVIDKSIFEFLNALKQNNNRDWFKNQKAWYEVENKKLQVFFTHIGDQLSEIDTIDTYKMYRIYRDVRFSKNKEPYKTYRSCTYTRATTAKRGAYHLEVSPQSSFIAVGFWNPNATDLKRIRKEFEIDDQEMRTILNDVNLQKYLGKLHTGNELKTAPKGFDKSHPAIDLIRKKSFLFIRPVSNTTVCSNHFEKQILRAFESARPFLDYMSDILTTDLNGETII